MKKRLVNSVLFLAFLVCVSPVNAGGDAKNFKEVMQRIALNMSKLIDPIMKSDFAEIDAIAEHVANHDEPPLTHRMRIIAELGLDFTDFKKYDDDVHMSSVAMQTAAKNKDIEAVIINYGKTMQNCNNCHKKYRERIRKMNF